MKRSDFITAGQTLLHSMKLIEGKTVVMDGKENVYGPASYSTHCMRESHVMRHDVLTDKFPISEQDQLPRWFSTCSKGLSSILVQLRYIASNY